MRHIARVRMGAILGLALGSAASSVLATAPAFAQAKEHQTLWRDDDGGINAIVKKYRTAWC